MSPVPPAFVAYIDESGDPGIKAKASTDGASEWFILSAVVVRASREPEVVDWVRDMREAVRSQQRAPIHFRNLSAPNQQRVCRMLSTKHVRIFTVASHKTNMRGRRNPRMSGSMQRGEFYNWCLRLLLERVSNWCSRHSRREFGEVRPIRTIFSERGGHDYAHLQDYLRKLDLQALAGVLVLDARSIVPGMVPSHLCEVRRSDTWAGLQLADIAASAMMQAVETKHGTHSLEGAKSLRDRAGREKKGQSPANYGLVMLPFRHHGEIPRESRPIFEYYGFRFE